ncbi:hypothetical protein FO526_35440, partial [Bacillus thuringiensis]|uniref:hypothetical protein n=1 Tax=Bacillus thuringiensis TaxID=1428 RepID=UPI0028409AC0
LNKEHIDLASLNSFELERMLNSVRNVMKNEGKYAQLMNDPFNEYLFICLDHTTSKVAHNCCKNLNKTPLRAKYSELSFGVGEKLKGLSLDVPNLSGNHRVDLRGKMD